jgi:hypothetical protein
MNSITLGGKTVYDCPGETQVPNANTFVMHTGAARYGVGRFLMVQSDYQTLQDSATDGTVELIMQSGLDSDADQQLKIKVFLAGFQPVSTSAWDENVHMGLAIVFDLRCTLYNPVRKGYNVQKQGFTYTGANPDFYASTLNSSSEWTWSDLLTDMELNNLPWPNLPSWKPRNIIFDNVPTCRAIDELAAKLFYIIGYDFAVTTGTSPSNIATHQTFAFAPGINSSRNTTLLEKASNFVIGGKEAFRNSKRLPATYRVTFPVQNNDSDDPFTNRVYTKDVTTGVGIGVHQLHVGEYVAIRDGSAWKNQTELDAVAANLAIRALAQQRTTFDEREYAGIWPFHPDGAIRGIRWISDAKGARTYIRLNNDEDFSPIENLRRANEQASNQLVIGYGSSIVAATVTGSRMVSGGSGGGGSPTWMKITGSTSTPGVALCKILDSNGSVTGSEFAVKTHRSSGNLYAMEVTPRTNKKYTPSGGSLTSVTWAEVLVTGDRPGEQVYETASATTVSGGTIGDTIEGSDSADSDTWTLAGDGPHFENRIYRVVYDDSGAEILRGYARQISYDSNGIPYSLGGEYSYDIDATEDCT